MDMKRLAQTRRAALTPVQRKHFGETLCPDHAFAFDMPEGAYLACQATDTLDQDDPIPCDACTVAIMRRAGAL